jgi:hypothetical protein
MVILNLQRTPPADDFAAESVKAGCPMLIRAAAPHPTNPGAVLMRCALGWSLHDAIDCARCAETSAVRDCWRVHPERTPTVAIPAGHDVAGPDSLRGPQSVDQLTKL